MEAPKVTYSERDKAWRFHYRDANNDRKTKNVPVDIAGSPSQADGVKAQAWCDQWYTDFLRGGKRRAPAKVIVKDKVHTFRSLHNTWLEFRRKHPETAEGTYKQFESHTNNYFLKHELADRPIQELDPHYLASVIREWKQSPKYVPNTVSNRCQSLTTFFHDVRSNREWGVTLASNPMKDEIVTDVIPARTRRSGRVTVYVPIPSVRKLLAASPEEVPPHHMAKWVLALYTGARDGEMHGAAISQVYLDAPVPYLDITRQLTIYGKRFRPPKKGSYRQIPLHPYAAEVLRAWISTGWKAFVGRDPKAGDPLFPDTLGHYHRPKSAHLLRADLIAVRAPTRHAGFVIEAHALRRTFATVLEDREADAGRRAALMGHGKKDVTDAHYIGRKLEQFVPTIRLLDVLRGETSSGSPSDVVQVLSRLGDSDPRPTVYETEEHLKKELAFQDLSEESTVHDRLETPLTAGIMQPPQAPPQTPEGVHLPTHLDPSNEEHVRAVMLWLQRAMEKKVDA